MPVLNAARFSRPGKFELWFCERVSYLWYVNGYSYVRISQKYDVSRKTVAAICGRFRRGEPLAARGKTGRPYGNSKLQQHEVATLLNLVECRNDLYLDEFADELLRIHGVRVSVSTVCRCLYAHGITRKRVRSRCVLAVCAPSPAPHS